MKLQNEIFVGLNSLSIHNVNIRTYVIFNNFQRTNAREQQLALF